MCNTIPNHFPSNGQDWFNYAAHYVASNHQIQAVLIFEEHLDQTKLAKAVRLTVDREPILGCHFDEIDALWKRRDDLDRITWCTMIETNDPRHILSEQIAQSLDHQRDPQVRIILIRAIDRDILCIKMNHACTDGAGVKECLSMLSDTYNGLHHPSFCANPNTEGSRDQGILFQSLGMENPEQYWNPQQSVPTATWAFPGSLTKPEDVHVVLRHFKLK